MKEDAFIVTGPAGYPIEFAPTSKGLYAADDSSANQAWAFINLVDDVRQEYTKRKYRDAVKARRLQNIIMFPPVQKYQKIVDDGLARNCPVMPDDVNAAERLFGSNIGALKGKTVYRHGTNVESHVDGIPPVIMERYKRVTISADIMFVNKIPFLITVSHGLRIGTVENLTNHQVPIVAGAFDSTVFRAYRRRGLHVSTCNADPEFGPIQSLFNSTSFNLCAQDEHVPEIDDGPSPMTAIGVFRLNEEWIDIFVTCHQANLCMLDAVVDVEDEQMSNACSRFPLGSSHTTSKLTLDI